MAAPPHSMAPLAQKGIDRVDAHDHRVEIVVAGQRFCFLPNGSDRLKALCALIDAARERLDLAFYIFEPDESGRCVRDRLAAAAGRGVAVRLIVDGFGTDAPDHFFEPIRTAGGHVAWFSARWSRRYLIRNHQKLVIADRRVALVGGFNISDEYFCDEPDRGWCDFGMRVEGRVAARLGEWFDALDRWTSNPRAQWLALRRMVRDWQPGAGRVQVLIGGPDTNFSSWHRSVRADLGRGQRLDMMIAYFSPAAGMLRRIAQVARRGAARLMLAGKSDNTTTIGAARSLYHYLLRNRVEIWEFQRKKLHAKIVVIDDVAYVGSANFDMRSLYLNLELMVRIKDRDLAEALREFIASHRAHSEKITEQLHRQRASLFNQIRWKISWLIVTVIDYTVTRKLNLEE